MTGECVDQRVAWNHPKIHRTRESLMGLTHGTHALDSIHLQESLTRVVPWPFLMGPRVTSCAEWSGTMQLTCKADNQQR